jgi:hypothetical protein
LGRLASAAKVYREVPAPWAARLLSEPVPHAGQPRTLASGVLQQAARLGADAVIDITFVEVAVMAVGRAPTFSAGTR